MNELIVRRLGTADSDTARELTSALLGDDGVTDEHLSRLLNNDQTILIAALTADAPKGFLIAHRFPALNGQTLVYLYDILVASSHRRKGIASAMVACLRQICTDSGVHRIWVGSGRDNQAACSLWSSLGAQRVSEEYVEFTFDVPGVAR